MRENQVEAHLLTDDGKIPNNPRFALLVYRGVLDLGGDAAAQCEERFTGNGWKAAWRNGVYPYHHYHAKTHEALGLIAGEASVRFGGESGPVVKVKAGDVVVIPAGVGHKRESASGDLLIVGAYPNGIDEPDMNTGKPGERDRALHSIPKVGAPAQDPVYGKNGPLASHWSRK